MLVSTLCVLVGEVAMFVSLSCVLFGLLVLTNIVMMGRLMMMMRGSGVVTGGSVVVLTCGVLR